MTEQSIRVEIYNQTYNIRSDGDNEYIMRLAEYVDGKMREIRSGGKVIGADRVAVMAALNITHDLLHKKQRLDQQADETRDCVRDLLGRVDKALATHPDDQ